MATTGPTTAPPTGPGTGLSKSRYLDGLRCLRSLWLGAHRPGLAAPRSPADRARLEEGHAVGRAAQALFPGGRRVDEPAREHARAEARTRALMADPGVPAIFEAAFTWRGVRIRVDVLERLDAGSGGRARPGRWGLREVKSSTSVKDEHLPDLALQRRVLRGCGLEVPSAEIVHLDREFVRPEGPLGPADWRRLFARRELVAECVALAPEVEAHVAEMARTLAARDEPAVEPGRHCKRPWPCPFWSHCTRGLPAAWHLALRRAGAARRARWERALATGRPWASEGLAEALSPTGPPAWYLDFEAWHPAIPAYPGTRPYQAVPFLWSLHRVDARGRLEHRDFLADPTAGDPRPALAATLLDAVRGDAAPILVWTGYERRILRGLADAVPRLAIALADTRERLVDLHAVTRTHAYHPGFEGSYSLKAVAPSLAPDLGWDDLGGLADGAAASAAWGRLAAGDASGPDAKTLLDALRTYCARDTLALARIHTALRRIGAGIGDGD